MQNLSCGAAVSAAAMTVSQSARSWIDSRVQDLAFDPRLRLDVVEPLRLAFLGTLPKRPKRGFYDMIWRFFIASALCIFAGQAFAACGDKGGPGYRSPSGRCVGWADIGRTCGNPPTTKCTAENVSNGAEAAAILGQKAWEAGKDARRAAGRSD
jgi:hypothetical protein